MRNENEENSWIIQETVRVITFFPFGVIAG